MKSPGHRSLSDDNQLLFVYGSLTNPDERQRLLHRSIEAETARIVGYARGRNRYYFVREQADAVTEGAILSGLSARDLAILDRYEEVPRLYTRERIEVIAADGRRVTCWIYMPGSAFDFGR